MWAIWAVVLQVTDIRFVEKDHSLMDMKLPPFKNGEHNSESTSTSDRAITPLIQWSHRMYIY